MRVDVANLKQAIVSLLGTVDLEPGEADAVSRIMAEADMKGISTHGIYFLPMLLKRIDAGLVKVPTQVTEVSESGALLHLDGGNGIGQVAAERAMGGAIEKARDFGIGMALVRNTNHIGLLAHYSLMAAKEGMIGICLSNSAPAMAPWGGAQALFGTNPFSIAAPGNGEFPIVLDMSTSIVARGKIRKADRLGERIPEGWALDGRGEPTTDPSEALKGSLLPIGGPKGYGMALFIDLIGGMISGSSYLNDVKTFHKPLGPTGVGMAAIAIDISRFMAPETYEPLIKEYIQQLKASPKAQGVERIFMPGEIELSREQEAASAGAEIDDDVVATINGLLSDKHIDVQLRGK